MPKRRGGDLGVTTPSEVRPLEETQRIGRAIPPPRTDIPSKIAAAETATVSALPTSIVYAGAMTASDDKESARWAVRIARELDLPLPRPRDPTAQRGRYKQRQPAKQILDPLTGKPVSLRRAKQAYDLGGQLGTLFKDQPKMPGYNPSWAQGPDPQAVTQYLRTVTEHVPDLGAETALALSLDMDQKHTDLNKLRANLAIASGWNEQSYTLSDTETLVYARWWTEHKDQLITPGDLVTITTPELTAAIQSRQNIPMGTRFGGAVNIKGAELDSLITARDKALTSATYLPQARRLLAELEAPTWMDKATHWASENILDPLNKITYRTYTEVATPFVYGANWVTALPPGGTNFDDALRETQKFRSNLIQRISKGGSIGDVYVDELGVPRFMGAGMDFAVGWIFDPLILGGSALTAARALRTAPGLIRVPGVIGRAVDPILRNPHVYEWAISRFSESRTARGLLESMYKGDDATGLFREVDRLATHFEARSPLEYRFMSILREKTLAKYPRMTDKAFTDFAEGLRAHFGVRPEPGSLADDVLRTRQGAGEEAAAAVVSGPRVSETAEGLVASAPRASEAINRATIPFSYRYEVPHHLLPVPGLGGGKLAVRGIQEALPTRPSLLSPNPGNIFRLEQNPEQYLYRRGTRWREFNEGELRSYQSQAIDIQNSGVRTEERLISLRDKIDAEALTRIGRAKKMPDEVIDEMIGEIQTSTRRFDQMQSFGVYKQGTRGLREIPVPQLESQLRNESFSADPILLRKAVNRYQGTLRNYVQAATNNLGATITTEAMAGLAREAYRATDFGKLVAHDIMRTWKFLVVPRPAYIGRVILLDEMGRNLSTTASITDRIMSQELKLGLGRAKVDVGAILDRYGAGETRIPIGNNDLIISRAGAMDYEPLASQQFRAEDAVDDLMRRSLQYDEAAKASGHIGIVEGTAKEHLDFWARQLNYQWGNSMPGIRALESVRAGDSIDDTARALREWAEGPGRQTLRSRVGVSAEDVPEWADDLAQTTHAYTMSDPKIADAAMNRVVEPDLLAARAPDIATRPPIHAPLIDRLTAGSGVQGTLKRAADRWYRVFVKQPEDVLNRQPYYKYWKSRAEQSLGRQLDAQGVALSADVRRGIDASSREFALEQVKKVMFDFTENTRLGEMISSFVPFMQPWMEAYQVWGHILIHRNPALVGYVRQLSQFGVDSGFVKRINETLSIPWTWTAKAVGMLPWFNNLPEGFSLSAPVNSMNLFFSQTGDVNGIPLPLPGVAPWVGIGLKELFKNTQNPFLTSYLFQYGFGTPMVPPWMERAARVIKPDAFSDDRIDSTAMDFLKWYQVTGADRDENGNLLPDAELKAKAREDALRVQGLLAVTGFFAPTAGTFHFPAAYEDKEAELEALYEADPSTAAEKFNKKYPELTLFTVGKTVTTTLLGGKRAPSVPSTEYADTLLNSPGFREFAQNPANLPWVTAVILAHDEKFDMGVFSKAIYNDQRRYRSLDEYLLAGQQEGFWEDIDHMSSWYYPRKEHLESLGLSSDNAQLQELETRHREELFNVLQNWPAYARVQGIKAVTSPSGEQLEEATWQSLGGSPPQTIIYAHLRRLTQMDEIAQFPAIQGLKAYQLLRDPIEEEMNQQGIDSITDTSARRAGLTQRFNQGVEAIRAQFPEVEPFLDTYFRNDLTSTNPSPVEDLARKNPTRFEQYSKFDTRMEKLNDAASGQAGTPARNAAYANLRDWINTAYETGDKWKVNLWYKNKSASGRYDYMNTLEARPSVFYSRFDWEKMGVKLSNKAYGWLVDMADTRAQIDEYRLAEDLGRIDFASGDAYEALDKWVAGHMGKDKTFDQAVGAMQTWGYGLWQQTEDGDNFTEQKGKAGFAWRTIQKITLDLNKQVVQYGLHGVNDFDPKKVAVYTAARMALSDRIQEFRAWSPKFDEQLDDFQRSALRGDPFIEWLMPDDYFPIGVVGDTG